MDPRSLMGLYREREESQKAKASRELRQAEHDLSLARADVRMHEASVYRLRQEVDFLTEVKP